MAKSFNRLSVILPVQLLLLSDAMVHKISELFSPSISVNPGTVICLKTSF